MDSFFEHTFDLIWIGMVIATICNTFATVIYIRKIKRLNMFLEDVSDTKLIYDLSIIKAMKEKKD